MPTYQYACTSTECGHEFELVQSFTEPSASDCPTCGGPVRKVFSAVGVVFKGSGFYRTDSRSADAASGSSSKSNESAKSDQSGDSSSSAGKNGSSSGKNGSSSDSSGSSPSSTSSSSSDSASSGSSTSKAAAPA